MFQCLTKEAFGGLTVSALRYKDINNIPILIHRTPQVVALTSDLNEHFIDVPDIAEPSLFPAQGAAKSSSAATPASLISSLRLESPS